MRGTVKYPVFETFYSFQGEGIHIGRAAFFIRLYGCSQACSWCDSAGTWHPSYRPARVQSYTAEELAALVTTESPKDAFVVITGGEPILFDLQPLTEALHAIGRKVHLETSGMAVLRGDIDWLTLSPKPQGVPPLPEIVAMAQEIKIIVHQPEDIAAGLACVQGAAWQAVYWLHPEWSKAQDAAVLQAIVEAVKANPNLRAGYQMHKLYRADDFDASSVKQRIPLGGNPQLGF